MKRTRTWLALLLFLHVVVHPLVHAAPVLTTASGYRIVSTAVEHQDTRAHDCPACRTAHSVVPIIGLSAPHADNVCSQLIPDPISSIIATVTLRHSSRAPPVL